MANVALLSLHRYFMWAETMKRLHDERDYPTLDQRKAHWEPYLAYWLGGLYVVVEGWKEQSFSDPTVEVLLNDDRRVDLLRRYRNGAFHYQASYFDSRFVATWGDDEVVFWARKLHTAFREWFSHQPETMGSLTDEEKR